MWAPTLVLAATLLAPDAGGPLAGFAAAPVAFSTEAPGGRAGHLLFRGGLALTASDPAFGGLSGLWVSPDGRILTAVSDAGAWVRMTLVHRDGALVGATSADLGRLLDRAGKPLIGKRKGDAEGLERLPGGDFVVAFERRHRLWRYAGDGDTPCGPARPVGIPPGLADAPPNGGAEALVALEDGRLLVLAESLQRQPGLGAAWVLEPTGWEELSYVLADDFQPTGAARAPEGDLLVVERAWHLLTGSRARVVRIAADAVVPGATLRGEELARLGIPLNVDNIEAIACRRGAAGETLVYLVSDDNFSSRQRTLLLLFALEGTPVP